MATTEMDYENANGNQFDGQYPLCEVAINRPVAPACQPLPSSQNQPTQPRLFADTFSHQTRLRDTIAGALRLGVTMRMMHRVVALLRQMAMIGQ